MRPFSESLTLPVLLKTTLVNSLRKYSDKFRYELLATSCSAVSTVCCTIDVPELLSNRTIESAPASNHQHTQTHDDLRLL